MAGTLAVILEYQVRAHAEYLCSSSMTSFVLIFAFPPCGATLEVAMGAIVCLCVCDRSLMWVFTDYLHS